MSLASGPYEDLASSSLSNEAFESTLKEHLPEFNHLLHLLVKSRLEVSEWTPVFSTASVKQDVAGVAKSSDFLAKLIDSIVSSRHEWPEVLKNHGIHGFGDPRLVRALVEDDFGVPATAASRFFGIYCFATKNTEFAVGVERISPPEVA